MTGHNIPFYKVDLMDTDALREVFKKVLHSCFAALISYFSLYQVAHLMNRPFLS